MTDARAMLAEANAFAMELLMPTDWLLADIAKMGGVDIENDAAISTLAKRYRVSATIMAVRIGQLLGGPNDAS